MFILNRARAIFLDRDGVLNRVILREGKPCPPSTMAEFEILPYVHEALSSLHTAGFLLYVVTNQPDVARKTQDRLVVESMNAYLLSVLPLDGIYVCYHDDVDACQCRKPKPGLLLAAASEHGLSLSDSFMIGDRWRDIDCGHEARCRTVFVDRGYSEELRKSPHFVASDLLTASNIILSLRTNNDSDNARYSDNPAN